MHIAGNISCGTDIRIYLSPVRRVHGKVPYAGSGYTSGEGRQYIEKHCHVRRLLQVLAPALATPEEPEQALLLSDLLKASADILAALCSQTAWRELHPDIAQAALSGISITSVSALPCTFYAVDRAAPAVTSRFLTTPHLTTSKAGMGWINGLEEHLHVACALRHNEAH